MKIRSFFKNYIVIFLIFLPQSALVSMEHTIEDFKKKASIMGIQSGYDMIVMREQITETLTDVDRLEGNMLSMCGRAPFNHEAYNDFRIHTFKALESLDGLRLSFKDSLCLAVCSVQDVLTEHYAQEKSFLLQQKRLYLEGVLKKIKRDVTSNTLILEYCKDHTHFATLFQKKGYLLEADSVLLEFEKWLYSFNQPLNLAVRDYVLKVLQQRLEISDTILKSMSNK